jgi:cytochrome c553
MRMWVGVVTFIAGAGLCAAAQAQGSAEAGATKAAVCLACHGLNGNSTNGEWPTLAGQNATYVAEQLRLFRAGKRSNPVMMPLAMGLSDDDINDLAAYYAAQKPAGLEADPSYWEAGEKLYRGGNVAKNVPACIACHGPLGRGNAPAAYPALRAQQSVYTQKQLNDYAAGQRPGEKAKIMETIAKRMSADDVRNVASYIQGMR